MSTTAPPMYHVLVDGVALPVIRPRRPGSPEPHPDSLAAALALDERVVPRGHEFVVDANFIGATTDRFGFSWASNLSDEAQLDRWGQVRFAAGPCSEWLAAELEDEARTVSEARRLEHVRESHRYGRRHAMDARR